MPKVLIADDERLANTALRFFLGDRGYEVRTAESATEALEIGASYAPDVLITDFLLGEELKGTDVARRLKAQHPALKVLLLTGLPREEVVRELAGLQVLDVCPKPFDLDAIEALLASI